MERFRAGREPSEDVRAPWGLWTRRELLRVGSIGQAAGVWPGAAVAAKARPGSTRRATADSVILLWMAGGVTHIDSFDPKPGAPEEVRGTLGTIDTRLPGVRFAESMPELARQAHRIALVRSYSHDSNDHFLSQAYALSGRKVLPTQIMTEPNVGSVVSYLQGPRSGLPGYVAVPGMPRPGPPPHNLFALHGRLAGRSISYFPFGVGGELSEAPTSPITWLRRATICRRRSRKTSGPNRWSSPTGSMAARLTRRAGLRLSDQAGSLRPGRGPGAARRDGAGIYQVAFRLLVAPPRSVAQFDSTRSWAPIRDAYGCIKLGGCAVRRARRLVEVVARFRACRLRLRLRLRQPLGQPRRSKSASATHQRAAMRPLPGGYAIAFAALIDDLAAGPARIDPGYLPDRVRLAPLHQHVRRLRSLGRRGLDLLRRRRHGRRPGDQRDGAAGPTRRPLPLPLPTSPPRSTRPSASPPTPCSTTAG